jgi:hypothetical protein
MSLPKTHRASLERLLNAHAKDVTDLRAVRATQARRAERRAAGDWDDPNPKPRSIAVLHDQCSMLDQQIERHEQLIALGRDERVLRALDELAEHPELVVDAAGDPRGYARARGIELSFTMDVVLRIVEGHPHLSVVNYDPLAPFSLIWGREGFRLLP